MIVLFFFIFKVPYKNMNYVYFGAIQMRKYCLERSIHWRKYSLRKYSLARMYKILPEVSDIWLCTHCLYFEITIESQEVHRNKRFTKIIQNSAGCCVLFAQLPLMLKSCVTLKKTKLGSWQWYNVWIFLCHFVICIFV